MRRIFVYAAALMILSSCDRAGVRHFLHRLRAKSRVAADATSPMIKDPERHLQFLERIRQGDIGVVFLGDSITDWWPAQGGASWARLMKYKPANFGVSGDRTEHLLWRISNGELEGIDPKVVVVLIGTNNIGYFEDERPEWVARGIRQIVSTIHERLPKTKILLLGIFPRGEKNSPERKTVRAVNSLIAGLGDENKIRFLDIGANFLDADGNIPADVMPDRVHLTAKGYEIWFEKMEPILREMTGGPADTR
jgi:lysophospholipase L1-like esterase